MCPMDNTPHNAPTPEQPMASGPLTRAVLEIDSHVSQLGWDRPAMLFALVDTAQLRAEEPDLAERIGLTDDTAEAEEPTGGRETAAGPDAGTPGGSLTPVEQDELPDGIPLDEFLATLAWPNAVAGCALTVERLMLPASAETTVPDELRAADNEADAAALARWVAEHPERREVRMTVAVLRDGRRESAIRLREKDADTEVLTGRDLVPGLAEALAATFEE
jgi:hypothetical protein